MNEAPLMTRPPHPPHGDADDKDTTADSGGRVLPFRRAPVRPTLERSGARHLFGKESKPSKKIPSQGRSAGRKWNLAEGIQLVLLLAVLFFMLKNCGKL
jgi:hypothetical protein